ncbi:ribonuclease HII [Bacillus horti]|nr:ribonuclease HII [Bacillus horti]
MLFDGLTITEIKQKISSATSVELEGYIPLLETDSRAGVQRLADQCKRKVAEEHRKLLHWETINQEEKRLREKGFLHIAGVDEVGRGPLAGPVVTAAVILPAGFECIGINDSKQLKKEEREAFAKIIKEQAISHSIAFVDARDIDRLNIYQATLLAMKQAVESCSTPPDYCLIDAMNPSISIPYESLIKGDAKSVSIAAASILAKVTRDQWMTEIAQLYPQYGFENHMGYATPEHQEALRKYGPTPIHRQTFIKAFINEKREAD